MVDDKRDEVPISLEEYRYVLVPWFGPRYQRWLSEQVRPDPIDPRVVRIPRALYEEYRRRPRLTPLTDEQKRRLGVR